MPADLEATVGARACYSLFMHAMIPQHDDKEVQEHTENLSLKESMLQSNGSNVANSLLYLMHPCIKSHLGRSQM